MKICISGLSSSGKTVLGKRLAKELNIEVIDPSYKDEVGSVDELLKLEESADVKKAKLFDDKLVKMADGKDCVVTTWFGPWLIKDAAVRVWLTASFETRARRFAKLYKTSIEKARKAITVKDSFPERLRRNGYKTDMSDHSAFDIEMNTERMTMDEMTSIISLITLEREKQKFR